MSATPNDLYHFFSGDLYSSNTGDLLPVSGTVRGEQRVLRRLLTNPGDYIFEPDYGAGLPSYVGKTLDIEKLQALCLAQMLLESCVAATPTPVVTITVLSSDFTAINLNIRYNDQPSNTPVVIDYNLGT